MREPKRALVVDDQDEIREIVSDALRDEGYDAGGLFGVHCERAAALLARIDAGLRACRALLEEAQAAPPALARRLTATLVCVTLLQRRPAGARTVGLEPARLLYRAGRIEIDLEISVGATPEDRRLLGQVRPAGPEHAGAQVAVDGPAGRIETAVDELGQFVVGGVAPGRHRLAIGLGRELVEVPDVQL